MAAGAAGLKKGSRVRHGKYGEGTVILREGDGEDAKLTNGSTRLASARGIVYANGNERAAGLFRSDALQT